MVLSSTRFGLCSVPGLLMGFLCAGTGGHRGHVRWVPGWGTQGVWWVRYQGVYGYGYTRVGTGSSGPLLTLLPGLSWVLRTPPDTAARTLLVPLATPGQYSPGTPGHTGPVLPWDLSDPSGPAPDLPGTSQTPLALLPDLPGHTGPDRRPYSRYSWNTV